MPVQEIPREEWPAFLESFSRQHEGWLVHVELPLTPGAGALVEDDWLLQRVGTEAAPDGARSLFVAVRERGGVERLHTIRDPERLELETTDEGADRLLRIHTAGGATTSVRFRSAILPEMVDGV